MDKEKELEQLLEERNKLLLSSENVIGWTATVSFLGSILGVAYGDLNPVLNTIIIATGTTIFATGLGIALKIEQKAGYYKCSKCDYEDIPKKYSKVFFAPHIGRTRYMKCDKCGERSWHKKVLVKSKELNQDKKSKS